MIYNDVCPYCRQPMLKGTVNNDSSSSVEHLIPHKSLTKKRGKGEGDFYACRKCNAAKSNLDYVIGIIAKMQSEDGDMASQAVLKALDDDKRNNRFIDMILAAQETAEGGAIMPLPVKAAQLQIYCEYLAKGQYFKMHGKPLSLTKKIVLFDIANKVVFQTLKESYMAKHGVSPFEDLKSNPFAESILDGECFIWAKGMRYLFIFHEGFSLSIRILSKNARNLARQKDSWSELDRPVKQG